MESGEGWKKVRRKREDKIRKGDRKKEGRKRDRKEKEKGTREGWILVVTLIKSLALR